MITLQQFLDKYLGQSKGYPSDSQYLGQCLSIVKLYIKECFGIDPPASGTGSAYGYWSNFPNPLGDKFEKVLNTDDLIPEKGWIGIMEPWDSNPYGHIFIVADGSNKSICKNWAQNWTSKVFQLETNTYKNIIGFLVPKGDIISGEMTEEQKRILDFIGNKTEGDVREAFGALADLPIKEKQIQTLQENVLSLNNFVNDLESRLSTLEGELAKNLKLVEDWQTETMTANKALESIEEQLSLTTNEKNNYKKWYEAKCDEIKLLEKMTPLQHIIYGIKKLFIKK